ncbi:MAG: 5'-methylthioadenosine/S-adenosylhomocysteine nucleosidase [Gammaproteobacteria bacterium]|nr:5'-methylthioadenosine/S-adenosylhomocysteine nucleosidase [Gammaproteobacteria bacterium]
MFIGFVGAMDVEIQSMIKVLKNVKKEEHRGYTFHVGERGNNKVVVTSSGVGKVNMAVVLTILLNKYRVDYIINSGIAGSIDTKIGTTCIASSVAYYDFIIPGYGYGVPHHPNPYKPSEDILKFSKEYFKDEVLFGKIISGDRFVTDIKDLGAYDTKGVVAVDMESATVAQVCFLHSVDFVIIRSISDNLSGDDYNKFEASSSELSFKISLELIDNYKRP